MCLDYKSHKLGHLMWLATERLSVPHNQYCLNLCGFQRLVISSPRVVQQKFLHSVFMRLVSLSYHIEGFCSIKFFSISTGNYICVANLCLKYSAKIRTTPFFQWNSIHFAHVSIFNCRIPVKETLTGKISMLRMIDSAAVSFDTYHNLFHMTDSHGISFGTYRRHRHRHRNFIFCRILYNNTT